MFSSIAVSPEFALPSGESSFTVAFLQAIFPLESERSNYQLILADRDGSNRRTIFPPVGERGIEPNLMSWSPKGDKLAIIYRKELWLIDPQSELRQWDWNRS
jgi:Tol biopolymer transport system component